jgi:hypothetical protein
MNPHLLAEGFLVLEESGNKGHLLFDINEFVIGQRYKSEKGTLFCRKTQDEIQIGGKYVRIDESSQPSPQNEKSLEFH